MRNLFTRSSSDNNGRDAPWLQGSSIYRHILDNLDPETGLLKPTGISLPDEERRYANTKLRWVAGARDGTFGYHGNVNNYATTAHNVATHTIQVAESNGQQEKVMLYNLLVADDLLGYIDTAISEITQADISLYPYIHDFALSFAKNAPDRGPVKFAIALLGIIGDQIDKDIVSTLGLHEEFTLYTAVALSNMLADPEPDLWILAQKVQGWGKIHLNETN